MSIPQDAVAKFLLEHEARVQELTDAGECLVKQGQSQIEYAAALTAGMEELRAIDWDVVDATTRKSGYNTGNGATAIDDVDNVAKWRSRPISAYSVFNWGHLGKDKFQQSYTLPGWTPARTIPILSHRGIMPVCTIPGLVSKDEKHPDVPLFTAAEVAGGALDDMHLDCAKWLAAQPWSTDVVLRLSRECNDPSQPFYYGDTPALRSDWRKAHARIFNIYSGELGVRAKFAFCVTKRAPEVEWTQAIPLDDFPRKQLILSIDAYLNRPYDDTADNYSKSTLSWLLPKFDYADRNGLLIAFSEWAVTDVDQPGNLQRHLTTFEGLQRAKKLHHEHYFGSTDSHALFGDTKFPKSQAAYIEWMSSHS